MCGWCLNDISINVQVVFIPIHIPLGMVLELWELNFDLQQERKKKKNSLPLAFAHVPFLSYIKGVDKVTCT